MAVAELNPLFFHNPILLPTVNPSPQNLPLLPFKNPSRASTLSLKTNLNFLTFKTAINQNREENESSFHHYFQNAHHFSVAFPALAFSNTLFFATNVTLVVGEDVGEEKLIGQFRREVLKAGVLQECRRRRFFESSQEKRKRKSREAARRNRKRRPQPKVLKKDKVESSKKKTQQSNDDNDNWEFLDIDLPYC